MGQGGSILTIKAGNSIPWKHNYSNKLNYAESFFSKKLLSRFFHAFFVRGLTYKINFLRFRDLNSFLESYYKIFKIDEGRKLFSSYPITGVFLSQLWINNLRGWVVISVTVYRVQVYSAQRVMLASVIKLKCFYDSFLEFKFDF